MPVASTLRNEHIKLWVSYLNSIAVTLLFAGLIGPLAKLVFENVSTISAYVIIWWCLVSILTHLLAQSLISDLDLES